MQLVNEQVEVRICRRVCDHVWQRHRHLAVYGQVNRRIRRLVNTQVWQQVFGQVREWVENND